MNIIKRFVCCFIFNNPLPTEKIIKGRFKDRGDYADQWGQCQRCKKEIHRDMHIYGDGIWRHVKR